MKIIRVYVIPILVIGLFVAIMNTGGLLKKPFIENEDVERYVDMLKNDVINENWQQANQDLELLKSSWRKVEKRVQFSVERGEMNLIDTNIARIQGALLVKDKNAAVIEICEVGEHWNKLEE